MALRVTKYRETWWTQINLKDYRGLRHKIKEVSLKISKKLFYHKYNLLQMVNNDSINQPNKKVTL